MPLKTVAFVVALILAAVSAVGVVAPSALLWIAGQSVGTSGGFYTTGVIRLALGVLLVLVAKTSRVPRVLLVLGILIILAGVATLLSGGLGMEMAQTLIMWVVQLGMWLVRLAGVVGLVIGGFIAWACAPDKGTVSAATGGGQPPSVM